MYRPGEVKFQALGLLTNAVFFFPAHFREEEKKILTVPFPREQHWQGVRRLDKTWRLLMVSHFWIIGPWHFL